MLVFQDIIPAKSTIESEVVTITGSFYTRCLSWGGEGEAPGDVVLLQVTLDGLSMMANIDKVGTDPGFPLCSIPPSAESPPGLPLEWGLILSDTKVSFKLTNHAEVDRPVCLVVTGDPVPAISDSDCPPPFGQRYVSGINDAFQRESAAVRRGTHIHEEMERRIAAGESLEVVADDLVIVDEAHHEEDKAGE